jgi:hypothetical protein
MRIFRISDERHLIWMEPPVQRVLTNPLYPDTNKLIIAKSENLKSGKD